MIGTGIVGKYPKISAILMILASVAGFFTLGFFYVPASVMFLTGGILALISRKEEAKQ
jgi:hypothetical protein